jgi:hypothetical protein
MGEGSDLQPNEFSMVLYLEVSFKSFFIAKIDSAVRKQKGESFYGSCRDRGFFHYSFRDEIAHRSAVYKDFGLEICNPSFVGKEFRDGIVRFMVRRR